MTMQITVKRIADLYGYYPYRWEAQMSHPTYGYKTHMAVTKSGAIRGVVRQVRRCERSRASRETIEVQM